MYGNVRGVGVTHHCRNGHADAPLPVISDIALAPRSSAVQYVLPPFTGLGSMGGGIISTQVTPATSPPEPEAPLPAPATPPTSGASLFPSPSPLSPSFESPFWYYRTVHARNFSARAGGATAGTHMFPCRRWVTLSVSLRFFACSLVTYPISATREC